MSTVAEQLRQGREVQHLSVEQVADVTKIRGDHLRALEEGNYNVFPAPVYIRGFVRSYSTLLKLDVPQLMAALDAELARTQRFAEPPPLSDHPRGVLDFIMLQLSRIDWRKGGIVIGVGLVLALLLLGYGLRRHYHNSNPLQGLKPGVYQANTQHVSGETLPLPAPRR